MKKILIIDDEKPTLSMFTLFLNVYGYQVHTAENGYDGIEVYKKESPQIVFTDVKMPEMDGIEVLSAIKKIDQSSEVIVITGHGDIELAIQSLDNGATDYINKPISRKALDSALSRAEARISRDRNRSFEMAVEEKGRDVMLNFKGFIDSTPLLRYEETILKFDDRDIEIGINSNFSINSEGIRGLITLIKRLKENNNRVKVTGIPENYIPVFEMTGVFKALGIKKQ